jgi:hypothetical protein
MRLLALPYTPSPKPKPEPKSYTVELTVHVAVTVQATSAESALDQVYQDHGLPRELPWHSTPVMVALLEKNPPSDPHQGNSH